MPAPQHVSSEQSSRNSEHIKSQSGSFCTSLLLSLQRSRYGVRNEGSEVHRLVLYFTSWHDAPPGWHAMAVPPARNVGPTVAMLHLLIPLRSSNYPECSVSGPRSLVSQRLVARQTCLRAFVSAALRGGKGVPRSQQPFDGGKRSDHDQMLADCCNEGIACVPGKARPGVTILSLPYAAVFDTMTSKTAAIGI